MSQVVAFKTLIENPAIASNWYNHQCEPHSGEFSLQEQGLLMALAAGMPSVMQGDADGAIWVYDLRENNCVGEFVGTTGLSVLWVTEDLDLTLVMVAGPDSSRAITMQELYDHYGFVALSQYEGWFA